MLMFVHSMIPLDRDVLKRGAVGTGAAVLVNLVLLQLVLRFELVTPFRPVASPPIVFLTIAGGIGATAAFLYIRDRYDDAVSLFRRVAAGVLVVSFLPDLGLLQVDPSATVSGALFLMGLHVSTAVILVAALSMQKD